MPKRILDGDAITTSERINKLSFAAEVFYHRLIGKADDFGRFDGRCSILRAALYPLRLDSVSEDDVRDWLAEAVNLGLVQTYDVGDKPYVVVLNWEKHQRLRNTKAKYPEPPAAPVRRKSRQSAAGRRKSRPEVEVEVDLEVEVESDIEPEVEKELAPRSAAHAMYLALCAACGINPDEQTKAAKRAGGIAANEILAAGGTPEQAQERAANYRLHFREAALTPSALKTQWAQCARAPAGIQKKYKPGERALELAEQLRRGENGDGNRSDAASGVLGSGLRP